MTPKQEVLKECPAAYCYRWGGWRDGDSGYTVKNHPPSMESGPFSRPLGHGDTEDEAWSDALRRMKEEG